MSVSVLYMSMSLDGYIAGPNDRPGNPGGDGFMRLHKWYERADGEFGRPDGPASAIWDELNATGAVLVGRRTAEQVDYYGGEHHDGVPIFVLTHRVPDDPPPGTVRYVTDVTECAAQARAAAGDGDVMVHGAAAAQALLRAGQLDELELHVVPVLLGQGRRLFDHLPAEHVELDLVRRLTTPDVADLAQRVTHLRYRIRRS